ncbi:uncharacterized protein LOC143057759 [Mytilus galloprovincialis]|uniref:uncharacterized protein LOC143057759 n=1 Tax=Mytilus galloprovincialis TaxID=29158 RepID=UPI003F7CBE72
MFSFSRVARSKSFPNITERKFYSSDVRRYLADALTGYEETVFMPLCCRNWYLGDNFSKARITTVQYLKDEFGRRREPSSVNKNNLKRGKVKTHLIPFSSMFCNGFHALKCFNNRTSISFEDNIKVEKAHYNRYLLQYALDAFVTGFLCEKDHHEECLRKILTIDDKTEISVIMANHLFSRLTAPRVGTTYYVTNDTKREPVHVYCNCSKKCGEEILYSNTGFGSELLWYGKPDIMVFPIGGVHCSIVIPPKPEDESADYAYLKGPNILHDKHSIDFNPDDLTLREKYNKSQIIATAITSSMHQKKSRQEKGGLFTNVSLLPLIAADGTSFDIYLYDSERDILLRNSGLPIPLWDGPFNKPPLYRLNMSSVLKLWMTINHASIQPSLSLEDNQLLSGTCDFKGRLPKDVLENIESTLEMKDKFQPMEEQEFDFDFMYLNVSPPKKSLPVEY